MIADEHEQDLGQDEERALRAVVEHGTEAEIEADIGRALAGRGLVEEGGVPDAPTFTATDVGRALVDEWQGELHTFMAGRAMALEVLRDDHEEWWTRAELLARVSEIAPAIVETALGHLVDSGVVIVEGERVKASPCAQHLDHLDLVGV